MASFVDEQAEVSDNDGTMSETSEPVTKKRKIPSKKRRNISSSDEEDEEDDEAAANEEMRGFVVNEDEIEDEEAEDKSEKSSDADADELLEDDLDLVNENIGRRVGGRVEISDDEDDREKIKNDLFAGGDDDDFNQRQRQARSRSASVSSRESYEDEDQFIVHDNEASTRHRRHRPQARNRAELREAQDIFGFEDEDVLGNMDEIFNELDEEDGALEGRQDNTLIGVIEPDELDKHDIEERKIVFNDIPERFQTRKIPVTPADDDELRLESVWIQQNAFNETCLISRQDGIGFMLALDGTAIRDDVERNAPEKIQEVLGFIRNLNFEVPFIAFYRKEHVDGVLGIQDLWTIFEADERWLHFRDRKKRLADLLNRMSSFVNEALQLEEPIRPVTEKDQQDLLNAQTSEEIMDCFEHFQLYYSNFLTRMVQHEIERNDDPEHRPPTVPKIAQRNDKYWNCVVYGPGTLASSFGLTSEQIAENFEYIRHHCTTTDRSPEEIAEACKSEMFDEVETVISGAVYLMAFQLSREPGVRRKIREVFRQMAKIRVYPTKRGIVTIDESHPLFAKRYIEGKPLRELEKTEYLQYQVAKDNNLLNIEIYIDDPTDEKQENNSSLIEDILRENYFGADENSDLSMKWNELRQRALAECVDILCKQLKKETHEILLNEAKNCVLREARAYFETRISPGKYRPNISYYDEDEGQENIDANNPHVRIIAVAPAAEFSGETTAVALDHNGIVADSCPISFQSRFNANRMNGENGNVSLRAFVQMCANHRPHVIAIAATDMRAINFKRDIEKTLRSAFDDGRLTQDIPVEFVTAEAARVYSKSKMSEREFPNNSPNSRLAISVGRTLLDPLIEYAHLCNPENDILGIRIHQLQNHVSTKELSWCFQREFINRVSEVGVDINYCNEFPHTAGVLQFVCGLGPRKATYVMQNLQQQTELLDQRSKLVTLCKLGPNVFVNAAGFIRIDIERMRDEAEDYVETLDASRIHPETYEWARKMCIDALEENENNDPASAIDEIIAQPERLKDLDLDAFAEELNRQGFGNKSITLYDIRAELNNQYKDLRLQPFSLSGFDLFKELVPNSELYMSGKLVNGRVQRVLTNCDVFDETNKYRKPQNAPDGGFLCPDCRKPFQDYSYLTTVHMGNRKECTGKPSRILMMLDDGVSGFINRKNISEDKTAIDAVLEAIKPGQNLNCRVLDFNQERLSCDLSCKQDDLDRNDSLQFDTYFNYDRQEKDNQSLITAKEKNTVKTNFTKRVISHQSFHNVTHSDAERMLSTMSQGEAVIRPSSSSTNSLAVTWKVTEGVYQHVRIEESKKKHAFDLGKELRINNEVFEDLDEILARFVTPLAEMAREVLHHKYFVGDFYSENLTEIEESIRLQKEKQPGRIPYIFTASQKYPGKFVISYQIRRARHEYFTATPEGFRFRHNEFPSLDAMMVWFKKHALNPIN